MQENISEIISLMDARFFAIMAILVLPMVLLIISADKRGARIVKKRAELKASNSGKTIFICDAVDDLGNGLMQFYGEPFGGAIRPNMEMAISGTTFRIKEVYADTENPQRPSQEAPAGMTNVAIVNEIEKSNPNFRALKQNLKANTVVAIEIR